MVCHFDREIGGRRDDRRQRWGLAVARKILAGDSPKLPNELAELVLAGKKRATFWAASEGPKTQAGKQWVVLDGSGVRVAVIEATELTRRRFDEADEAFAFDEGEGERTLAAWRRAHQNYFGQQGTFAPDMLLYCERFRLVARINASGSLDLTPSGGAPGDQR